DPTETKRVKITDSRNTQEATPNASGASTANAPAAVATPFPPRKRSHIGYTWPTTDANAAMTAATGPADNNCAARTATVPFTPSSTIASNAARTPVVRNKLDAQMFPLTDTRHT